MTACSLWVSPIPILVLWCCVFALIRRRQGALLGGHEQGRHYCQKRSTRDSLHRAKASTGEQAPGQKCLALGQSKYNAKGSLLPVLLP